MCGIAGIFGETNEGLARQFCRVLYHRGPDDEGFFMPAASCAGHPVTLASRRLAILDLSPAAHQPMLTADGRLVLVYNGELFNFGDLRAALESKGHHFHSSGDTEVVLDAVAPRGG